MEVTGPCALCERVTVLHTCSLCGRNVCREHWDAYAGTCVPCARRGPSRSPSDLRKEPENIPPPPEGGGRFT